MARYAISYKTAGDEYFCAGITWYVEVSGDTVADALNVVLDLEKKTRVTEFVRVKECE